jgi:hypothetical protein
MAFALIKVVRERQFKSLFILLLPVWSPLSAGICSFVLSTPLWDRISFLLL